MMQPDHESGGDMSDDILKTMLDQAQSRAAAKDAAAKTAQQKREDDTRASGVSLKEKIMPRLLAAQAAWDGRLKLDIVDHSARFDVTSSQSRSYPSITIKLTAKEFASYTFETHSPGYVAVREGSGSNRGNNIYEFQINELSDLTDQKIDRILESLVNEAHGLKDRR
jgi:hypothetical protein